MKKLHVCITALLLCFMLACTACGKTEGGGNGGNGGGGGETEPVYSISLSSTSLDLELTHSATLTATLLRDGAAMDGEVQWSTSDANVASVAGGVVTALNAGSATVTASANGLSATCAVTVTASYLPSLAIGVGDSSVLAVLLDGEYKLVPYVTYDGSRQSDGTFEFASADSGIVSVESDGTMRGEGMGTTTVTVTGSWRGFGASVLSQVYPVKVSRNFSVGIATPSTTTIASSSTLPEGYNVPNTVQLTAEVSGDELNNPTVAWHTSDASVATVSSNGLVTGIAEGVASIHVTYTDAQGEVFAAVPVVITVEFPVVDKTSTIDLGELDASDAYDASATGLVIDKRKVFGNDGPNVTEVYEVTATGLKKFTASTGDGGNGIVRETGSIAMTAREQVWEVRNAHYAYRVKVFVITRVINNAADLMLCFNFLTTGPNSIVLYGAGAYYVLGGNIDASGTTRGEDSWTNSFVANGGSGFQGEFDGKGYTIDGLTVQNGGLFGNLAPGSVVKNFALTNITLTTARADYQPAPLAYSIYGDAVIENVFIHIAKSTAPAASSADRGIRGFANMSRGAINSTHPTATNVVISMDVGNVPSAARAASLLTNHQTGNYLGTDNVHVISDYSLVGSNMGDNPAAALSDVTRYGNGAKNTTFTAAFEGSSDVLQDAGLSADYWTYSSFIGYPVFTTYADGFFAENIRTAVQSIPDSIDLGAGSSWSVPAAAYGVTLSGTYAGVTLDGGTISADASVTDGSFDLTITSQYDDSITKTVTVNVQSSSAVEKARLQKVFAQLSGKTYEFGAGSAAEWSLADAGITGIAAADFGEVTLSSNNLPEGVTIANGAVTIAQNAAGGEFTVTVTSNDHSDVSADITISILNATQVTALAELSKNADDAAKYGALSYSRTEGVGEIVGTGLTYRASGATDWIAADGSTFGAGSVTVSRELLDSLAAGAYEFRVIASGAVIEFTNVTVYTDVITDAAGLMAAFNHRTTSNAQNFYGAGTYYVLGGNIDASGTTRGDDNWTNDFKGSGGSGFQGKFDGKGYTIDGLTVQNGGLFGNLAPGSVVKNFALTNITLTTARGDYQPAPIAYCIYGDALVENVFIHIAKSTAPAATGAGGIRGFAHMVRGVKGSTHPTIRNIVINMDIAGVTAVASLLTSFEAQNYAQFTNVHVVSTHSLLPATDTLLDMADTVTRYADADAFKAGNATLEATGLSAGYWTYNDKTGYAMFTTAVDYIVKPAPVE